MTTIWYFLAIKYQLSNTLKHVCFEKLPRSWEFTHYWRCLFQSSILHTHRGCVTLNANFIVQAALRNLHLSIRLSSERVTLTTQDFLVSFFFANCNEYKKYYKVHFRFNMVFRDHFEKLRFWNDLSKPCQTGNEDFNTFFYFCIQKLLTEMKCEFT